MSQVLWVGSSFRFAAYSGPVQDYIDRVITADVAAGNTQGLDPATKDAYDVFITGCISDGILGTSGGILSQANSLIKAACIKGGARTLSGALISLIGTAPTRLGTEAGWDYNRKTGLKGNGTNNYLNTNRAANADPQNSMHICVYKTSGTSAGVMIGSMNSVGDTASHNYIDYEGEFRIANRGRTVSGGLGNTRTGLFATNRSQVGSFDYYAGSTTATISGASSAASSNPYFIFNRSGGSNSFSQDRLIFYSIGESVNLATLKSRLDVLTAAIAAIP